MKILFAVEDYYPKISGVPNVTRYLCEGLVAKGENVSIVTRKYDAFPTKESLNGVDIYRFDLSLTLLKRYTGEINEYIHFVLSYNSDVLVLVCSQCITTDLLLPYLDRIPGVKIFYTHGFSGLKLKPFSLKDDFIHTIGNTYNWIRLNYYYKKITKYLSHFDCAICLSSVDSGRKILEKYTKLYIISNAADEAFFRKPKDYSNPLAKYIDLRCPSYFVSIANYSTIKNQKLLLKEFYAANFSDYAMVFIGSYANSYYNSLLEYNIFLSQKYGKKEVYLLHSVDRKDIPGILSYAKLYLSGSDVEEFSISLVEAMAVGVPFVSTNVGNAHILPGGITTEREDIHKIIKYVLEHPEVYGRLSAEGKIYAWENCRQEVAINLLYQIFSDYICKKSNIEH